MPKNIAVCDQVLLFREGVTRVLDRARFEVVLSVRTLEEIVKNQTVNGPIDLIVLGVNESLPPDFSPERLHSPAQGQPMVVVLATSPTSALIRSAIGAGIRAVLPKDISGDILSSALELVLCGHSFFPAHDEPIDNGPNPRSAVSAGHTAETAARMDIRFIVHEGDDGIQLSEREEQILCRLISGAPNKSIARDLAITDATVKVHIKGLLRKLRVTNRTQAAIWGMNYGFSDGKRMDTRVNRVTSRLSGVHADS